MPILRNTNPIGAINLPLIGRDLVAGEEFEVTDEQAGVAPFWRPSAEGDADADGVIRAYETRVENDLLEVYDLGHGLLAQVGNYELVVGATTPAPPPEVAPVQFDPPTPTVPLVPIQETTPAPADAPAPADPAPAPTTSASSSPATSSSSSSPAPSTTDPATDPAAAPTDPGTAATAPTDPAATDPTTDTSKG